MILARNNGTPLTFFLSCTLPEFAAWIKTNNEIVNVVKPGDGDKLKDTAVKIAGGVKDKVLDLAAEAAAKRNAPQDADIYEADDEEENK